MTEGRLELDNLVQYLIHYNMLAFSFECLNMLCSLFSMAGLNCN